MEVIQTDVSGLVQSLPGNCTRFSKNADEIWVVYCCPPYSLWETNGKQLLAMLERWWNAAPPEFAFLPSNLRNQHPLSFCPPKQTGIYEFTSRPEWPLPKKNLLKDRCARDRTRIQRRRVFKRSTPYTPTSLPFSSHTNPFLTNQCSPKR